MLVCRCLEVCEAHFSLTIILPTVHTQFDRSSPSHLMTFITKHSVIFVKARYATRITQQGVVALKSVYHKCILIPHGYWHYYRSAISTIIYNDLSQRGTVCLCVFSAQSHTQWVCFSTALPSSVFLGSQSSDLERNPCVNT